MLTLVNLLGPSLRPVLLCLQSRLIIIKPDQLGVIALITSKSTIGPVQQAPFMLTFAEVSNLNSIAILWALVINPTTLLCTVGMSMPSVETIWPSFRWQEREGIDMLGLSIRKKRDTRSLFLPSMLGLIPLRKATPTSGFFELVASPSHGLVFKRLGSA